MKIACTIAIAFAASMLVPRPAQATCSEEDAFPMARSPSSFGSSLRPVGPHPIIGGTGRSLVASGGGLFLVDNETMKDADSESIGDSVGTPIPVNLGSSTAEDYAAFVGRSNGVIQRVNVTDSSLSSPVELQKLLSPNVIESTPAVHLNRFSTANFDAAYAGNDLVYVATADTAVTGNRVYALNADTFATEWIFNESGSMSVDAVLADPVLDIENDRLYIATDRSSSTHDSLFAIDTITGNKAWSANVGRLWTSPVVRGDRIYVVTLFGEVKALSIADGSVIWSVSNPDGNPVISDMFTEFRNPYNRLIAMVDFAGKVWMVQDGGSSGMTQWHESLGEDGQEATSRVAIDPEHGKVYVGDNKGFLHQLNLVTGAVELSREVASGSKVGVPTMVFENDLSDVRLIAGAESGDVAKFCFPWVGATTSTALASASGDMGVLSDHKECSTRQECPDEPPNSCSEWACKNNVCVAVPVPDEEKKECPHPKNPELRGLCISGACRVQSECDLTLDSCECSDIDSEGNLEPVSRRLLVQEQRECETKEGLPTDRCGTEVVTVSPLNQCLGHGTESLSAVAVHLFDQRRRPFTNVTVTMKFELGDGEQPPVWFHPKEKTPLDGDTVTSGNDTVLETGRDGTYFALLGSQTEGREGGGTRERDVTVHITVEYEGQDGTLCGETPEIPPAEVRMGDPDSLCLLDSNIDEAGYLKVTVVDESGQRLSGVKVVVGHATDKTFFSDFGRFVFDPLNPDLPNVQVTGQESREEGVVEFFDFGNNMNGPLDVTLRSEELGIDQTRCVTEADAVIDVSTEPQTCRQLFPPDEDQ